MLPTANGIAMSKRNTSDHSYTRPGRQETLSVLRLGGFWGNLLAIAMLLLVLPLVIVFFLFFVAGLVVVALIGMGYAWWHMKKFRRVHPPGKEEAIELAASEYRSLEESGEEARYAELKKQDPYASERSRQG